jgi:type 1 glutamine amidotransferase
MPKHLSSSLALPLLFALACSGSAIETIDLPNPAGSSGAGGSSASGGSGAMGGSDPTGGLGGTGGASATGGAGAAGGAPPTAGNGGTTAGAGAGGTGVGGSGGLGTGGAGGDPAGGMAGALPMGGTGGSGGDVTGGTAGTGAVAGSAGGAGAPPTDPYAPRTGPFKVLVYSKTGGFPHNDAIAAGKTMLTAMGTKQGFEVVFTGNPADVNAQNLAQFEVFFGLNPTGNNLSVAQKAEFEAWMTMKNGAFAGVHSSTDHENGWAFWADVTGQNFDNHDTCCTQQNIQWDPGATGFVAVAGLPSPWTRSEEWYKFNAAASWSNKPGFKILSRVTTNNNTRPVSFVREWSNFRSFYTSLGHQAATYSDALFIRHVAAGLMWAARREALFKP